MSFFIGQILDLYTLADMPMDTLIFAGCRITTTNMQSNIVNCRVLLIIITVMNKLFYPFTTKFFRPMTFLTGIPGGTQTFNRSWNRTIIITGKHAPYLTQTGNFGFNKPADAGADMTLHTGHLGMW